MEYRFHIQDFFIENQKLDTEFLRCIQHLYQKNHQIIILYRISECVLQRILEEELFHNTIPNKKNIYFHKTNDSSGEKKDSTITVCSFEKQQQKDFDATLFRRIEKPWGYEEIWAHTESYVAKRIYIKPHHRLSLQYHEYKAESLYVQEGTLLLWESSTTPPRHISPNHFFHIHPHRIHRFGAEDVGVLLLEVSTTELEDVIRIEDDFGRDSSSTNNDRQS
jgi:mannose-6-phosphate isomerase